MQGGFLHSECASIRFFILAAVAGLSAFGWGALEVKNAKLVGCRDERVPLSYVQVTVENTGGMAAKYEVVNREDYKQHRSTRFQFPALAPGESRVHHLALPFTRYPNLTLVDSFGKSSHVNIGNNASNKELAILHISEVGQFASQQEITAFSKAYDTAFNRGGSGYYSSSTGTPTDALTQLEPENLPPNWLCYVPFYVVMVRESTLKRAPAEAADALYRYVEAGGTLVVYQADSTGPERRGAGKILRQKEFPVTGNFPSELLTTVRNTENVWQAYYSTPGSEHSFPYAIIKPGGRNGALAIAAAFLLIAGPVNYFYFQRKGRIRTLLVSLPLISIGFCLLITIFFIATQGFARRGGTFSISWFDETSNRGFASSRHCLFSGLYPLGGFKFGPQTLFAPCREPEDYSIDYSGGLHLKDGLFFPNRNFHYFTLTPFQSKERLIYDPKAKTIVNGFEKAMEHVVLEDDGRYFSASRVASNEKAVLQPLDPNRIPANADDTTGQSLPPILRLLGEQALDIEERNQLNAFPKSAAASLEIPGIHYAAVLRENFDGIEPGIAIRDGKRCNILVCAAAKTDGATTVTASATPMTDGGGQ
jgi:hypothetical protein